MKVLDDLGKLKHLAELIGPTVTNHELLLNQQHQVFEKQLKGVIVAVSQSMFTIRIETFFFNHQILGKLFFSLILKFPFLRHKLSAGVKILKIKLQFTVESVREGPPQARFF